MFGFLAKNRKKNQQSRCVIQGLQAAGLRTIASHLHRGTTSLYSNIAIEADRIVRTWEKIAEYIQDNSVDYITIFSTDGDMYQFLKHPHITLHDFSKKITKQDVENKIGLPVEKYVCWKTIVGDPSDNLPGMKRFGPQRAKELLSKYESLFEIPVEIFIIYHISDIVSKNTSQQLKDYRTKNNLSLKKVKEMYGLWWKKIEDGKKLDLNKIQYEDLCKIVSHNLNCPFEDYNETLSNQYKIIKLPFVQGV